MVSVLVTVFTFQHWESNLRPSFIHLMRLLWCGLGRGMSGFDPSTQKTEARSLQVPARLALHREFQATQLNYETPS